MAAEYLPCARAESRKKRTPFIAAKLWVGVNRGHQYRRIAVIKCLAGGYVLEINKNIAAKNHMIFIKMHIGEIKASGALKCPGAARIFVNNLNFVRVCGLIRGDLGYMIIYGQQQPLCVFNPDYGNIFADVKSRCALNCRDIWLMLVIMAVRHRYRIFTKFPPYIISVYTFVSIIFIKIIRNMLYNGRSNINFRRIKHDKRH